MKTTIKIKRTKEEMEMARRNKERETYISVSVPKKRMNRNRWEVLQSFNSRTENRLENQITKYWLSIRL